MWLKTALRPQGGQSNFSSEVDIQDYLLLFQILFIAFKKIQTIFLDIYILVLPVKICSMRDQNCRIGVQHEFGTLETEGVQPFSVNWLIFIS